MDSPAATIARLDASLARRGETVTVRRWTAPTGTPRPKTDVTGRKAHVRTVKNEEMVGDIKQDWSNVIMSPTGLSSLLPLKKGDVLIQGTRERRIEIVKPIVMADVLVRIELVVGG